MYNVQCILYSSNHWIVQYTVQYSTLLNAHYSALYRAVHLQCTLQYYTLSIHHCTVLVQVLSSGVSQGEDPHLVTVAVQVLSCGVSPYLVTVAVQVLSCGISQGEGPDQSIVLASSHLKRTNWKPKAGPLFCVLQCVSSDETNTNGLFDTYAVS